MGAVIYLKSVGIGKVQSESHFFSSLCEETLRIGKMFIKVLFKFNMHTLN